MFRLAPWYRQLASLTRAGITIPSAVSQAYGPSRRAREALAEALELGGDPREVWPDSGLRLAEADSLLLAAGQLSGRFPDVCDDLAERHETAARLRSRMFTAVLYPLFLIHAALALGPFMGGASGGENGNPPGLGEILTGGALGAVFNIAVLWLVLGGAVFLLRRFPDARAKLVRLLPIWSGAARNASLATFAGTLASLLRAGVGIGQAWHFAGRVSGDPRIAGASAKVARAVEDFGTPPRDTLRTLDDFPGEFVALYTAGEMSGSLEARLDDLRRRHEDSATLRATSAAILYPIVITVFIMLMIAAKILSFWSGYFNNLGNLGN